MRNKINNQIITIRDIRKEIQKSIEDTHVENKIKINKKELKNSFFKTEKTTLKSLKIAAIMDRFTLECFKPECNLLELTPQNWQEETKSFTPDLLFIESAWEGKDKLWYSKVNRCSDELVNLINYYHEQDIPVLFWSKEDPVYNHTFLPVAKLVDYVFTTDIECVEKYKAEVKHNRVYHLHFGAQPKTHNPIEKFDRKDKYCFAGAYYHHYPERCRVFDDFSKYFIETRGYDIYDRNFNNPRAEYTFPKQYKKNILGCLDPSDIDIAYKGYVYGINMNSVTQSQSMFARRVFELMASNTIVIGNYSRGVKNYFGDLTFCTDDGKTLRAGLEKYCSDTESSDKFRLLALRKVLSEHLMEDRLDYIVQKVFGRSLKPGLPEIVVYSHVKNQQEADRIITLFSSQNYDAKKLLLISDEAISIKSDIKVMSTAEFGNIQLTGLIGENGYLANFDVRDWYGKNYLFDLALATRYGNFGVIGKAEYFVNSNGSVEKVNKNSAYHLVSSIANRRSIVRTDILSNITGNVLTDDYCWNGKDFMSVDAMNYCENNDSADCPKAEDMVIFDQGVSLAEIEKIAENIEPLNTDNIALRIKVETLKNLEVEENCPITLEHHNDKILLESNLPIGTHQYLFLNKVFDIDLDLKPDDDNKLWVLFHGKANVALFCYCIFFDDNGNKLAVQSFRMGVIGQVTPPENSAYMQIAYRISGPGTAEIKTAEFGNGIASSPLGGCYLSRSNALILTNHYPAPDNLYRNMFVHKRLTEYKNDGKLMDVMRIASYTAVREFEGINIVEGRNDLLKTILSGGSINTVCVHFLVPEMWEVLKNHTDSVRSIIWVHGAEIQPWWRREYNYKTEKELNEAKVLSDERMTFWYKVFKEATNNPNIHFVFVSKYFRDEIFEDYKITLPDNRYSIIHNCIDTEQFNFIPKNTEDRKKLLSIRPYASNKYANDLTVKAILELSKESWFDELEISLYGRGVLYQETLAPLKKLKNVKTVETFLTQQEIADLHKQYGIFLTPTRMDAQGVSRDEAMSSGLIPVTNAVTAIPEFVDENCGILAEGEDYVAMAEGIKKLYHNPELFLQMSENAAKRVRSQTSREFTIEKELKLIFPENS